MSKNLKSTKKQISSGKNRKKDTVTKKIILDLDNSDDEIFENKKSSPIVIKKKIKNTKNDEENFENKMDQIREALRENYIQQKKLMNDLKELMTLHKKEIKMSTKSGNRSNSGKHTGFNKPEPIPLPLKKLLKIDVDELPRSQITKLMYQYFTLNKMYNTKTKKEIIPNKKIIEIFGKQKGDVINFYNLQTWLKKVYNENTAEDNTLKIDN